MTILRRSAAATFAVAALAAAPAVAQGPFGTAPVSVPAPGAPPQVELRSVTVAMGPTYDRVVFTWTGPPPRTRARYVSRLIADGSGNTVRIPGKAFLELVFDPARAHDQDTGAAGCAPTRMSPNLPVLKHVRLIGDFEGQVTHGLGLARKAPFRITRVPSRRAIVVDVRR